MEYNNSYQSSQRADFSAFDNSARFSSLASHYSYSQNEHLLGDLSHVSFDPGVLQRLGVDSDVFSTDFEYFPSTQGDLLDSSSVIHSSVFQAYATPTQTSAQDVGAPTELAAATFHRLTDFVRDRNAPWSTATGKECSPQYTAESAYYSEYPPVQPSELGSAHPSFQESGYLSGPSPEQSFGSGFSDERYYLSPNAHNPDTPSVDMRSTAESPVADSSQDEHGIRNCDRSAQAESKAQRGGKQVCPVCTTELKCPSDFKKHMLTHDKPHKCDVPGCSRREGFSTTNDLDRHKASVHKMMSSASRKWQCVAPNCRQPDKLWPRLDNFKQHLIRMHKGIDLNSVIESSARKAEARLQTDLGGVGAGADFKLSVLQPRYTNLQDSEAERKHSAHGALDSGHLDVLATVAEVQKNLHSDRRPTLDQLASHIKGVMRTYYSSQGTVSESGRSAKFLEEVSTLVSSQDHESATQTDDTDVSSSSYMHRCSKCTKQYKRPCDLRKHQKRHGKPYVCTAVECNHRSGSKFDWQRHELSCVQRGKECVHNEYDRVRVCFEADLTSHTGKCGFVHTCEKAFERHLKEAHNIEEAETLQACLEKYDMGFEPGTGWCGFCLAKVRFSRKDKVIRGGKWPEIKSRENQQMGYGKYSDRADHIDFHVSKEGRNMDQYVSLEYHLRKDHTKPSALLSWFKAQRPGEHDPRIHNPSHAPKNRKKRKRTGEGCVSDGDERRRKVNEAKWTCCQCTNYQLIKVYPRCLECDHERCVSCMNTDDYAWADSHPYDMHVGLHDTQQLQRYPIPGDHKRLPLRNKDVADILPYDAPGKAWVTPD